MAGLSDILSAYREGLAGERQFRTSEMETALSQLQYETEISFREEGRRREDAFRGLTLANQTMKESVTRDAGSIYSLMRSLDFIKRDSDGTINKFKYKKGSGFTEQEATNIYSMVFMYENDMQTNAELAAISIGKIVSSHKDSWSDIGVQSDYLKALSKQGVLYSGETVDGEVVYDETKFNLSYEPFVNVSKGVDVLSNISAEFNEMASGEYELQRNIGVSNRQFAEEQANDDVIARTADLIKKEIESRTVIEEDDIMSDISIASTRRQKVKSLIGEGYEGFDAELISLNKEIETLSFKKVESKDQLVQEKINRLSEDILAMSGATKSKKNIQIATNKALNILGAEASSFTTSPPFPPESIAGLEDYDYFSGSFRESGEPNIPYE